MEQNLYSYRYWLNKQEASMYKQIGPCTAIFLRVHGNDLNADFRHIHERVTFPSEDQLEKYFKGMEESHAREWEDLLLRLIKLNNQKLGLMLESRKKIEKSGSPFFVDMNEF